MHSTKFSKIIVHQYVRLFVTQKTIYSLPKNELLFGLECVLFIIFLCYIFFYRRFFTRRFFSVLLLAAATLVIASEAFADGNDTSLWTVANSTQIFYNNFFKVRSKL